MCKDVRNSYIVHKLGIQRVPYDIRNYAVMRVFGKMSWGYYAGLRFPKTGHPEYMKKASFCKKLSDFINFYPTLYIFSYIPDFLYQKMLTTS